MTRPAARSATTTARSCSPHEPGPDDAAQPYHPDGGGGQAFPRPSLPAGACAHSRHHPPAVQGALPGAQEQPRPFARPQADRVRPADPRADARPDAPSDTHAPLRPVPCSRTSKKQHGNMMSDAVFASALGCLGGVATRKAGVQCTAWRGTAGESWGSGRSARADMAGGHSEHANDAALDQVASATASALGAIKQQAMSSAATLVETMRAEPWPSLLSGAGSPRARALPRARRRSSRRSWRRRWYRPLPSSGSRRRCCGCCAGRGPGWAG